MFALTVRPYELVVEAFRVDAPRRMVWALVVVPLPFAAVIGAPVTEKVARSVKTFVPF